MLAHMHLFVPTVIRPYKLNIHTVLYCPPFCLVVLFMPPPHWHRFQPQGGKEYTVHSIHYTVQTFSWLLLSFAAESSASGPQSGKAPYHSLTLPHLFYLCISGPILLLFQTYPATFNLSLLSPSATQFPSYKRILNFFARPFRRLPSISQNFTTLKGLCRELNILCEGLLN